MGGQACMRGMRVTVSMIASHIAEGVSREQLLAHYPYIADEDITEALKYAAVVSQEREIPLVAP